jgi:hypothetical protein
MARRHAAGAASPRSSGRCEPHPDRGGMVSARPGRTAPTCRNAREAHPRSDEPRGAEPEARGRDRELPGSRPPSHKGRAAGQDLPAARRCTAHRAAAAGRHLAQTPITPQTYMRSGSQSRSDRDPLTPRLHGGDRKTGRGRPVFACTRASAVNHSGPSFFPEAADELPIGRRGHREGLDGRRASRTGGKGIATKKPSPYAGEGPGPPLWKEGRKETCCLVRVVIAGATCAPRRT